ncbi:MAG: AMP-binding protein [Alphaproteobacteria bacterium]|jgi:acyl-CoA synthetase (AMP-forming)/AMP-acid ligase II|nr:AMP-binding protein [Alphaproteobacteria bacterium]
MTFVDISTRIRRHAADRPDDEALVVDNERIRWSAFDRLVNRCANALIGQGVQPGDRVAVLAPTSAAYLVAFLGILRAGAVVVPLSPMAGSEALGAMVADSGAVAVFAGQETRTLAEACAATVRCRIAFDFAAPGWLDYAALATDDTAPDVTLTPALGFNLIYSSGTTGTPKGIVHDHATRTVTLDALVGLGFGPDCRTLVATPLYSNTTLAAWLPTLGLGGTVVLMTKFDARRYLELAQGERITHSILVPVQYQRILADPEFDRFDLSAFRFKMVTSAPIRAAAKREIVERWPGPLLEMYGLTEGGGICTLDVGANPDKLDTVGKPAWGCDVRIIDERGVELLRGQVGEIVGRGPVMMSGYHNQPDRTAEIIWRNPDGDVFFRSGDLGWFDDDGFLHLSDRKKDMIISGGFNIYATDLEVVLAAHPAVRDVAVIGIPSREWGETPLALVVLRDGASPTAEDLRGWANERLGKAQRLAAVEFREALPRNALGKILKRELRQPYW